ncbi:hypothetical protein, partial [uncultured Shewanella sp.]|uniref:hypothetical protein n=1 Tax=uncultured Shewanella sp. TaxID=173975 RepID=UPI00261DB199
MRSIPDKGIGFGALGLATSELPRVSFNYLGQMDNSGQSGGLDWQLTSEPTGLSVSGQNKDVNLLNINGAIMDGQLTFNVASQLDAALSHTFVNAFEQALIEVVDCATAQATQGGLHTPS